MSRSFGVPERFLTGTQRTCWLPVMDAPILEKSLGLIELIRESPPTHNILDSMASHSWALPLDWRTGWFRRTAGSYSSSLAQLEWFASRSFVRKPLSPDERSMPT